VSSYKFVLKQQEGEKCYCIPKAVMEREYDLLEEEVYVLSASNSFTSDGGTKNVIYLEEHHRDKKRLDNAGLSNLIALKSQAYKPF
jgi:hypothetical protein